MCSLRTQISPLSVIFRGELKNFSLERRSRRNPVNEVTPYPSLSRLSLILTKYVNMKNTFIIVVQRYQPMFFLTFDLKQAIRRPGDCRENHIICTMEYLCTALIWKLSLFFSFCCHVVCLLIWIFLVVVGGGGGGGWFLTEIDILFYIAIIIIILLNCFFFGFPNGTTLKEWV